MKSIALDSKLRTHNVAKSKPLKVKGNILVHAIIFAQPQEVPNFSKKLMNWTKMLFNAFGEISLWVFRGLNPKSKHHRPQTAQVNIIYKLQVVYGWFGV